MAQLNGLDEVCVMCYHAMHDDCEGQGCYCDCQLEEDPCIMHDEADWCTQCGGCPECGNCYCGEDREDDDDY